MPQETGENPFLRPKRGSRIIVSPKDQRTEDGVVFDSKWEKRVYTFLREHYGKDGFQLQPVFQLQAPFVDPSGKKQRSIEYRADFLFGPVRTDKTAPLLPEHVVIDAKGMKDAVFKIKLKMFMKIYGKLVELPSRVRELNELKTLLDERNREHDPVGGKEAAT